MLPGRPEPTARTSPAGRTSIARSVAKRWQSVRLCCARVSDPAQVLTAGLPSGRPAPSVRENSFGQMVDFVPPSDRLTEW